MRIRFFAIALSAALLGLCACVGLTRTNGGEQAGSMQSVQHIVYMVQENRSFDHYFGQLGNIAPPTISAPPPTSTDYPPGPGMLPTTAPSSILSIWPQPAGRTSDDSMESHVDMNENHPGSSTILLDGLCTSLAGTPSLLVSWTRLAFALWATTPRTSCLLLFPRFSVRDFDRWFSPVPLKASRIVFT